MSPSADAAPPTSSGQGPMPVPNSTTPFWRTELHKLDSHRSTEELPEEADIVIIGAGFSGAALAHHILDGNTSPAPSIVILEARQACSGATGRNGGHLKPDVYFAIPKYIKRFGVKAAIEVADFEAKQVFLIKELVEREKIDCDFTLTRACDVILHEEQARETEEAHAQLVKSGVADVRDVHYTPRKYAERVSGVKGALGAWTFTAGHIWPYKLIMHLLQGVVNKGANLQTHTPVTSVSNDPLPDGRWLVTTERGSIKAKKVIFATNGYTAGIAPQFKDHIVPVRGICGRIHVPSSGTPSEATNGDGAVTQHASNKQVPHLPNTYSIRYGPGLFNYIVPRNDGSIILGGAKQTWWHEKEHWYNVTDDSTLIEPAIKEFDNVMQKNFIGWEDSGAEVDRIWTGIMGYTNDSMPYIGHMPGKPGQMVIAGFNGHGMPLILLAAKAVVEMMQEGKTFEETGAPSLFKITQERLDNTHNYILNPTLPVNGKTTGNL